MATREPTFRNSNMLLDSYVEIAGPVYDLKSFALGGFLFQETPILASNIELYKQLNLELFPVKYNPNFYSDIVKIHPKSLCKLIFCENEPIAAVACRKEYVNGICQVYIMTLGVKKRFRRLGIASYLLQKVLAECEQDSDLMCVCLHVHVSNQIACKMYKAHGFVIGSVIPNYYANNAAVQPPDAYVLKKIMNNYK